MIKILFTLYLAHSKPPNNKHHYGLYDRLSNRMFQQILRRLPTKVEV